MSPRIEWHFLLQIRTVPLVRAGRTHDQRLKPFFSRRKTADVEPEVVDRLAQNVDLRAGDGYLRLAQLREIARPDYRRQHADDDEHHQQFEQRETLRAA